MPDHTENISRQMLLTNVHLHPPYFYKLFTNVRKKNCKISEHFVF